MCAGIIREGEGGLLVGGQESILWISGWAYPEDAFRLAAQYSQLENKSRFLSVLDCFKEEESPSLRGKRNPSERLFDLLLTLPKVELIVGWSLGATLAIETLKLLQEHQSTQIPKLLAIAGRPYFPLQEGLAEVPEERWKELRQFRSSFQKSPGKQLLRFYRMAGSQEGNQKGLAQSILDRYGEECLLEGLRYLEERDNREALRELRNTVLFLRASNDKVIPLPTLGNKLEVGPYSSQLGSRPSLELFHAEHNLPETHYREIGMIARMLLRSS